MKIEIYPGEWRDIETPSAGTLIPFIRAFPSGEKRLQQIERPMDIYMKACRFIAHGGRYLIAVLPNQNNTDVCVEMIAAMVMNETVDDNGVERGEGHIRELANEAWVNGPGLEDAVDRLVLASVEKMDAAQ